MGHYLAVAVEDIPQSGEMDLICTIPSYNTFCDRPLNENCPMRVLLISPNIERLKMPTLPLGLAQVAAAVRQRGHEVLYLDLLGETAPESAIQQAMRSFARGRRNLDPQHRQPGHAGTRIPVGSRQGSGFRLPGRFCRTDCSRGRRDSTFLPLQWRCWGRTTALLAKGSMRFRCSSKGLGNDKKSPAYLGFTCLGTAC